MYSLQKLTLNEIAALIGAPAPLIGGEARFKNISTDTRTIQPGDVFLAIKGEVFDGHQFCAKAVERGAGALIVQKDYSTEFDSKVAVLRPADPLRAYGDLAAHQRETWGGKVIAVSGSVGKTTTRRLIARSLAPHVKTLEPMRNFNNLIGVPQTLLRLEPDHEVAVMEMGMNLPGELERLTQIVRPNIAGITRIGLAHVGMFGTEEALIKEEISFFLHCHGGVPLIINAACTNTPREIHAFTGSHSIIRFRSDGLSDAECYIDKAVPLPGEIGYEFSLTTPHGRLPGLKLRHFGRHMLENVAAAAAFLFAAGYDPAWVVPAVENFETEPLRGQTVKAGEWTFILDCYNAAPDAMKSSLETLREQVTDRALASRLIVVLADMLELGDYSRPVHEALLDQLRPMTGAQLMALGPECSRLAQTLSSEGWNAEGFSDAKALIARLNEVLLPGDWVYFKGSHGYALEKVAQSLAPDARIEAGH